MTADAGKEEGPHDAAQLLCDCGASASQWWSALKRRGAHFAPLFRFAGALPFLELSGECFFGGVANIRRNTSSSVSGLG